MSAFPRKFLSRRDNNRSKSAPPGGKSRHSGAEALRSLFKSDNKHGASKGEDGNDTEADEAAIALKVQDIHHRLDELGITGVSDGQIRDIMRTKYAEGDPDKTIEIIEIEQKSASGMLVPYDPRVHMVGAENRGGVTCYLDTLLFSMFAKMDAFECILKDDFPSDDPRKKLVNLLRIWVNMLRSGKLIRTDLTQIIQETLAECGWEDARNLEQQDTSEAFAFLADKLRLPLLSLQVDLFHHGMRDDADHKVVYERLLNLAVPPDPDGKGIKLEDCLEEYFNSQVDVLRESEEAKKSILEAARQDSSSSLLHRQAARLITGESQESTVMTASPVSMAAPSLPTSGEATNGQSVTMQRIDPESPRSPTMSRPSSSRSVANEGTGNSRAPLRHRSTSLIQNMLINGPERTAKTEDSTVTQKAKGMGSKLVKAVTIPAWQFFRLIPWNAVAGNVPENDVDVAMNFDQRPVVGICLKRYLMTDKGEPKRHNTYIDIPDSLRLPYFMLADKSTDGDEGSPDSPDLDTEYKLVLQSVICHRGDSLQSGHYIAFARVAPKLLTDNRRHDFDPPPDYEEAQWVQFDDLVLDGRVRYVDDIKKALKEEMPYLLFYQILPMVDAPSTEATEPELPSYDEFEASMELPSRSTTAQQTTPRRAEHDANAARNQTSIQSTPSKPPSIRFSTEMDRARKSSDGGLLSYWNSGQVESGRPSMSLTDSAAVTPARTPDHQHSPGIAPADESTASRLSRAAARFKGKQSRPTSQSGENRVSSAMSRVAGLMMRPSREVLGEPSALNITNSGSTDPASTENMDHDAPESTLGGNSARPSRASSQNHGKNGKQKDKQSAKERSADRSDRENGKRRQSKKSSDQPERECVLM